MGFERTVLGEFAKIQGGAAYKSKDFQSTGDCPVLKIKNVRFGYIQYHDTSFIDSALGEETENWSTREGDILISMTGSGPNAPQSLVGRVGRVWRDDPRAWINQRVGRIQVKPRTLHSDFIFYLLSQKESQDFLVSNSSGSANQANISGKTIEMLPCPKLEFEESRDIAHILRTLDEKIILNRQTNETLEKMAQALFKSWFVDFDPVIDNALEAGNTIPDELQDRAERRQQQLAKPDHQPLPDDIRQLFPSEFELTEELGWVPKGWLAGVLANIASYEKNKVDTSELNLANYISTENMNQGKSGITRASKLATTNQVPSFSIGQTLVSNIRPYFEKIWLANCSGGRSNDVLAFQANNCAANEFLFNLLYQDSFFQYMTATSKGTKMPRGDKVAIMSWPIVIPSSELMEEFSSRMQPSYLANQLRSAQSNSLKETRETLLPKLISGELRLPSDGVASTDQQLANATASQ